MSAIFLTDADSLLGRHVLAALRAAYPHREIFAMSGDEHDLSDRDATLALFERLCPSTLIHLQSRLSREDAWWEVADRMNWDMQALLSLFEASAAIGVTGLVTVARALTYPADASVPMAETDYMTGQPDHDTAPYAHPARLSVVLGQTYRWQYGLNATHIVHSEMFGELAETTDVLDTPGRIIADLIAAKKFNKAQVELDLHADQDLDIIYAGDLANSIVHCAVSATGGVLNQSTGEITVRALAEATAEAVGYTGTIKYARKPLHVGRPLAVAREQELGLSKRSLRQTLELIAKQSERASRRRLIEDDAEMI